MKIITKTRAEKNKKSFSENNVKYIRNYLQHTKTQNITNKNIIDIIVFFVPYLPFSVVSQTVRWFPAK